MNPCHLKIPTSKKCKESDNVRFLALFTCRNLRVLTGSYGAACFVFSVHVKNSKVEIR